MKRNSQAKVSLRDLFGYSGESTSLMSQSLNVLIIRIQDMVNNVLPDGHEITMEWESLDLGEPGSGTGTISVEGESPVNPYASPTSESLRLGTWKTLYSRDELKDFETMLTKITSESERLSKKLVKETRRADAAEKSLASWEESYKSDSVETGETPERKIDLG